MADAVKIKGQLPNERHQCYCQKEGRWLSEVSFYQYKDGSKTKFCKKCLTMHVDNFDEDTFVWILQDMDVPYVPEEWNILRDRAFAADPKKMNGLSVMGKYLAKMHLKKWKDFTWADSEELQKKATYAKDDTLDAGDDALAAVEQQIKEQFESGQISQAQYKTLMPSKAQYENITPTATEELYLPEATFFPQGLDMGGNAQVMAQEDVESTLTQEDRNYLSEKWGSMYQEKQWIALEKDYAEMNKSFDIQDADTENSLIIICKLNLKANQCLDCGDYEGFTKLSRELGNQRKLANFAAAARKTTEQRNFVDSVGQLVAYCEKVKGQIPRYKIDVPLDIVDKVIQDQKAYTTSLIKGDPSLAKEIEDYIKKKKIQEEQKRDRDEAIKNGLIKREVTVEDEQAYREEIQKQRQEDAVQSE